MFYSLYIVRLHRQPSQCVFEEAAEKKNKETKNENKIEKIEKQNKQKISQFFFIFRNCTRKGSQSTSSAPP